MQLLSKDIKIIRTLSDYDSSSPTLYSARYYFQIGFGDRQQYDVLVKEYEEHFQLQKITLLHNATIILDAIQQDEPDQEFLYTDYILYMKNYNRAI